MLGQILQKIPETWILWAFWEGDSGIPLLFTMGYTPEENHMEAKNHPIEVRKTIFHTHHVQVAIPTSHCKVSPVGMVCWVDVVSLGESAMRGESDGSTAR